MVLVCSHSLPAFGSSLFLTWKLEVGIKCPPAPPPRKVTHGAAVPVCDRSVFSCHVCYYLYRRRLSILLLRHWRWFGDNGHPPDGSWSRQVKWGYRCNRLGSEGSAHTNAQCLCQEVFRRSLFFSRGYSAWLCWPLTQFKVDVGELTSNKVLHRVSPVNLY